MLHSRHIGGVPIRRYHLTAGHTSSWRRCRPAAILTAGYRARDWCSSRATPVPECGPPLGLHVCVIGKYAQRTQDQWATTSSGDLLRGLQIRTQCAQCRQTCCSEGPRAAWRTRYGRARRGPVQGSKERLDSSGSNSSRHACTGRLLTHHSKCQRRLARGAAVSRVRAQGVHERIHALSSNDVRGAVRSRPGNRTQRCSRLLRHTRRRHMASQACDARGDAPCRGCLHVSCVAIAISTDEGGEGEACLLLNASLAWRPAHGSHHRRHGGSPVSGGRFGIGGAGGECAGDCAQRPTAVLLHTRTRWMCFERSGGRSECTRSDSTRSMVIGATCEDAESPAAARLDGLHPLVCSHARNHGLEAARSHHGVRSGGVYAQICNRLRRFPGNVDVGSA